MIGGPIGTYYLTLHTVFKGASSKSSGFATAASIFYPQPADLWRPGNSTFAGATAAVMANFVLIAYVVVAMKEDQNERLEAEKKAKEKKGL